MAVAALPTLPHGLVHQKAAYRVVDGDVHLDVAVPQLTGTPVLNRRLRDVADTFVLSFRRTLRREAGRGPGRYHAMTVGWQLVGQSKQTTGIQLWIAQQHGLRVEIDRVTVWYDASAQKVLAPKDLFAPAAWPAAEGSIAEALSSRPAGARTVRDALDARGAPEGNGPTFGFTAAGDLALTFAPRLLSEKTEPVSLRLAGDRLGSRLSKAGLAARAAAQAHQPWPAAPGIDCAKRKCVALTFDDGPGSYTAELVAILQQRKVQATFFLVGDRIVQAPDVLAVVHSAGMEVGNHSTEHRDLTTLESGDMKRDLAATSQAIAAVTGRRPTLLRPPYGARNNSVDKVSQELGMVEVLWDVDTLDWRYANSARVTKTAMRLVRRGSIILLHDVFRTTVASVPDLIDELHRRGFSLVTVSQLLGDRPVPGQVYRRRSVPSQRDPIGRRLTTLTERT